MIAHHEKTTWLRCNKRRRCPCCGRPDYCLISEDGTVCMCMRTPGGKQIETKLGTAWIHKLDEPIPMPVEPIRKTTPTPAITDWTAYHDKLLALTDPQAIQGLSDSLGVSVASLTRLGAAFAGPCYHPDGDMPDTWAFPMRDVAGEITGLRLRANDGRKWSKRGSHGGLFLADGAIPDQITLAAITEGPSDAAAVLDLGLYAIGRQSCSSDVAELVQAMKGVHVVIIGDRDTDHHRPDGTTYRPGQEGAHALAAALYRTARSVKLIFPLLGKDCRQWLREGCSPAILKCVLDNAMNWEPERKR